MLVKEATEINTHPSILCAKSLHPVDFLGNIHNWISYYVISFYFSFIRIRGFNYVPCHFMDTASNGIRFAFFRYG